MNEQRPPEDDYDQDRTRIAPHRRPGQRPLPPEQSGQPGQSQPGQSQPGQSQPGQSQPGQSQPGQQVPPVQAPYAAQPLPQVGQQPPQSPPPQSPPQESPQGPPGYPPNYAAPQAGGYSDDPADRTNLAGPVRFQPTPVPPGEADRKRRRGVILVVGLALVLIAGAIAGVLLLALGSDSKSADGDGDNGEPTEAAPPEPGLVSYHTVVAELDEEAAPSEEGNMVVEDIGGGKWIELGPAVLDQDDVEEATAKYDDHVHGWVVSLDVTDESRQDFFDFNEEASCADTEMERRVASIVNGELVTSQPTNITCGTDLNDLKGIVINGWYDEEEANELADKINNN